MAEHTGWLLDLYDDLEEGLVCWLITEAGERLRLRQDFPVTFYACGPNERLRALWRYLQPQPVRLRREERSELFCRQPLTTLAVQAPSPQAQARLFAQSSAAFPELTFYDADLPSALRHAAAFGSFPLCRCRLEVDAQNQVQAFQTLDSPWELDPTLPPLRILSLEPDCDPAHAQPAHLRIRCGKAEYSLRLAAERPLLVNLRAILQRHDPDILLTTWGDTWLLPHLLELAQAHNLPLPLNRDAERPAISRPELTYFSYGQVIYRGAQVHLFGRWHIDAHNAMLYHDYGMEGILEMCRVTAQPAQSAARLSPGSGISAMQMITALRQGVLVPWQKQQAEQPKTALELFHADQGGLVYQPTTGVHSHVAEIDFISMYPSVMVHFNISPETVGSNAASVGPYETVPELDLQVDYSRRGLVPQTLAPLLEKRIAFKARLAELPAWDPRRLAYKARASAHKWLLVTCFGYLGYKNARFGRIEAHEAVTAYGREALLRAKETAEELGFDVLHMYVDGLWVRRSGATQAADFRPLLEEIAAHTGLPIALEGVYRWVAFLPSRRDPRVPVANRYFGAFQDGSLKLRGIEARRRDTPLFVAQAQQEIITILAQATEAGALAERLPLVFQSLRRRLRALHRGRVPLEHLLVKHKLSRELENYRCPSAGARAAAQLQAAGKDMRPGQNVRFLYTRGSPGVHAWDLPQSPDPRAIDLARYTTLLVRAAACVLQPLGLDEQQVRDRLLSGGAALPLPLAACTRDIRTAALGESGLEVVFS
jgi:DNA polymerase-2